MVIMAEHAGFCFGVKRAVSAIEKALKEENRNQEVWTIGFPIHNPQEVSRLEELGLKVANDYTELDKIPEGAKVLIRAHGEPLEIIRKLKEKNIQVEDMTCPFVKKAQDFAAKFSEMNYHVVVLGDKNHPEIKGIIGHAVNDNYEVVADENEAEKISVQTGLGQSGQKYSKIALISQTTQREERLSKVAGILTKKSSELHVCNTICKATSERQEAARKLVRDNKLDGVVLIGGRQSANTAKLRDIIQSDNISVLWIEDENEIESNSDWFKNKFEIGIAAGASTPEWLIMNIKSIIAQKAS